MKKTKKAYEEYLNASYDDSVSESQAIDTFLYLSSKKVIINNHRNRKLGSLLRMKDPILFNIGYREWCGKKG